MKRQIHHTIWFLILLVLLSVPHLASAYYDPGVQRWINRDPLGEAYGGLDALEGRRTPRTMAWEEFEGPHLFRFVRNNPAISIDPYGRSTTAVVVILGGIGAVILAYEWYELWEGMCHALYVSDRAADINYQRCSRAGENPDQPASNPPLKKTCVRYGLYK